MELTRKQQQIRDGYKDMSREEQRLYDAETREYLASLPRRMARETNPGLDEYQHEAGMAAEARFHYIEACKAWPSEEARIESKPMLVLEDEQSRFEAELKRAMSDWDEVSLDDEHFDHWQSQIERAMKTIDESGISDFNRRSLLRFARSFELHPLDVLDIVEATADHFGANTYLR